VTALAEPKQKKNKVPDVEVHDHAVEEFDWQAEYPGEDVFVFTAKDGTTVGLAAMGEKRRPKPGVLRKLRFQPSVEQMWFILERVSSPAALAVSDEFDDEDYAHMWEQWSDWSNTSAGESSRSSAS
jgi:hypothetical protein